MWIDVGRLSYLGRERNRDSKREMKILQQPDDSTSIVIESMRRKGKKLAKTLPILDHQFIEFN